MNIVFGIVYAVIAVAVLIMLGLATLFLFADRAADQESKKAIDG